MPRGFLALWTLALGLAFSGCATSSPIQRYAESESSFSNPPELIRNSYPARDVYRVYHRAATGFVSVQSIRAAAEQRITDFASRQGKSFVVLGERISQPPYILGNFPRIEIVFALIDKNQLVVTEGDPAADKYAEIERLKKLLDSGALTPEEFAAEKAKVLARP
ncbi:SHOCT domain-containing protein [Horticoccus luteus]|uniref:SHOCT domain-containing protein n=1 Tax=Horticoccus luteus TaxID=2862869 RepID=A0A8F9TZF5_9BACT|nr:SHOCT domain-containing protein [Horticoccus luteus]QYM80704.1 SHOCT domain-containing protein [Horticoccus luteus]